MTNGYGFKGFASGLQSGLSLGLESQRIKALADERKALDKAKEEEKLAMNTWLMDNRKSIENYSSLPQEERNWLIATSFQYSDKMATFFNDWDKAIKTNDTEAIKNAQKQWEDILATKKDLALAGISLSEGFFIDGSQFDPNKPLIPQKETDYLKQIEIGKVAGGQTADVMARKAWETQGLGELPAEAPKLSDIEVKMNLANQLGLSNQAKAKMIGAGDNAAEAKAKAIYAANGTDEDVVKAFGGGVIGPEPTTDEEIKRTDIAYWEKTFAAIKDEEEYNRQYKLLKQSKTSKEYEPKPYKDMAVSEVKAMVQELKSLLTNNQFRKVMDSEGKLVEDEDAKATYEKYRRIYEQKVREIIAKYPDIDITQFPKYLPIEQIKKVGFLKGAFTGGGVAKGDYSVIDTKGW